VRASSFLRLAAWTAVCGGIALPLARRRLRLPAAVTALTATAAPFGLAIAVPRSKKRDAAVYALQMWAYIVLHELPYDDPTRLERRVHVDYPIAVDRALFGRAPTPVLQRALARGDGPTALDHALVYTHWAWFIQPHAAAAYILWRHPQRFPRSAVLMCAVFDLGLAGYFLVPTAPPWWAAEHGRIQGMRRIMVDVGRQVWGRLWSPLYGFLGGNPLAAMPSLHFATSLMAAHVLTEADPAAGAVGWAYAGTLGFALVYLGEHYVVDLIAGAALAEGIRTAGPRAAPALAAVVRTVQTLERRAAS
jgi:membrane-associated phospholipid phosphatase